MQFPSKLSYVSFLQYSPRGTSKVAENSRAIRDAIKSDSYLYPMRDGKRTVVRGIEYVVAALPKDLPHFAFLRECLGPHVALVPIPRSAPLTKGALWPSQRICEELVKVGLGAEVLPLLKRVTAVQKAATAGPGMRPGPEQHYESTIIDNEVPSLIERPLTLVDDFVTRGASFVGMFRRVKEAFPNREIRCFALVRTESTAEITTYRAPVEGTIIRNQWGGLQRDSGSSQQPTLGL